MTPKARRWIIVLALLSTTTYGCTNPAVVVKHFPGAPIPLALPGDTPVVAYVSPEVHLRFEVNPPTRVGLPKHELLGVVVFADRSGTLSSGIFVRARQEALRMGGNALILKKDITQRPTRPGEPHIEGLTIHIAVVPESSH